MNSSDKAPRRPESVDVNNEVPDWFLKMFLVALILTILAIWIIPGDLMQRWAMWWNNIH